MPKEILLTQGKTAVVDDEDFEEVSRHKWSAVKLYDSWYATRRKGARGGVLMHREILDCADSDIVDHKDGNGLNNRRSNIRIVTQSQNRMNAQKAPGLSSRFKGVCFNKAAKKWQTSIRINGKAKYLGLHEREEDAARAYDNAARANFGEYARLNFPKEGG